MSATIQVVSGTRNPGPINYQDRIDPMYEVDWEDGIGIQWTDISAYKERLRVESDGSVSHFVTADFSPIRKSGYHTHSPRAVLTMAALCEFDQLTTFQVASWLGTGQRSAHTTLNHLFEAGILKKMIPGWWNGLKKDYSGSGSIWRINRGVWTTEMWFDKLSDVEHTLVVNNVDPSTFSLGSKTPQAIRHNMISAEIILKAMETIPTVIGGWGERHTYWTSFVDPDLMGFEANAFGDSSVVMKDGRIIVFEVTAPNRVAQSRQEITSKASAWAAICAYSDMDLHVVFVDATGRHEMERMSSWVKRGLDDASQHIPSAATLNKGRLRIYTANGLRWFPFARTVSTEFSRLIVQRVMDDKIVQLSNEQNERSRDDHVVNTLASLHVPSWIVNDASQ